MIQQLQIFSSRDGIPRSIQQQVDRETREDDRDQH
jgi:hypothetical protein